MFENQPKGLFALALANTGERFGYYTMIAVFALFLRSNFGFDPKWAGEIYGDFLMLVYFLPIVGGYLADKFGYGKMVTIGIIIMFLGYLLLSVPLGGQTVAIVSMLAALLLISLGTGLFKGNLQVMVGNLYDDPRYTNQRDAGFSLFYMAINIGALFAPTAAVKITEYAQTHLGYTAPGEAYHFAFMVACASLVLSIAIYYLTRSTFRHTEETGKKASKDAAVSNEPELSKEETKARIVALLLVFAVVIFFWMAFHQNGLSLTYFADEFTAKTASGVHTMPFDVINLVMLILIVYAGFSFFESKTGKGNVYMYYFDQNSENTIVPSRRGGASHVAEMPFIYGYKFGNGKMTETENHMLSIMSKYWINFTKTGNPNGDCLPYWTEYAEGKPTVMIIKEGFHLGPVQNQKQMDLFEGFFGSKRK